MMYFGKNIRFLRQQKEITLEELARKLGYKSYTTIAKWESGVSEPSVKIAEKIANYFKVDLNKLLTTDLTSFSLEDKPSVKSVPVLGRVQAGIPTSAVEDIIGWEELSPDMVASQHEFFGLKVKGDSMSPIFLEGDVVIIKCQNDCENGQDCVVIVGDDEATLKRVFKKPTHIILQPLNREYAPIIIDYTGDVQRFKILGVVAELRRRF